jgi:hypothetical protein
VSQWGCSGGSAKNWGAALANQHAEPAGAAGSADWGAGIDSAQS